jgi:hypothetical protein
LRPAAFESLTRTFGARAVEHQEIIPRWYRVAKWRKVTVPDRDKCPPISLIMPIMPIAVSVTCRLSDTAAKFREIEDVIDHYKQRFGGIPDRGNIIPLLFIE